MRLEVVIIQTPANHSIPKSNEYNTGLDIFANCSEVTFWIQLIEFDFTILIYAEILSASFKF